MKIVTRSTSRVYMYMGYISTECSMSVGGRSVHLSLSGQSLETRKMLMIERERIDI